MIKRRTWTICLFLIGMFALVGQAEAGGRRSEKMRPRWLSHTPQATNPTYSFYVVSTDMASGLEGARMACVSELMKKVEHTENVRVREDFDYLTEQKSNASGLVSSWDKDVYGMRIESDGGVANLNYKKVDEYWESYIEGGRQLFRLYVLYMVARPGAVALFDDVRFTTKYGARGLLCSLVPGMGQFYKGSKLKGACFLGGEAALAVGIVLCENTRASYIKKMKEQPSHASTYNSRADNWETGRNVCIGVAAALYVYNLVDAAVANGAKRVVVNPRKVRLSVAPTVVDNAAGIGFALNF